MCSFTKSLLATTSRCFLPGWKVLKPQTFYIFTPSLPVFHLCFNNFQTSNPLTGCLLPFPDNAPLPISPRFIKPSLLFTTPRCSRRSSFLKQDRVQWLYFLFDILVALMMIVCSSLLFNSTFFWFSWWWLSKGGQLTPRAVPRLRGGHPWREDAHFDTFYMAFRWPVLLQYWLLGEIHFCNIGQFLTCFGGTFNGAIFLRWCILWVDY